MDMRIFLGIILVGLSACSKYNIEKSKSPLTNPAYFENGPGTVLVDSNFYMDQTEITNFNWLEYMYWTEKIFGYKSPEHLETIPDTTVWSQYHQSLAPYENSYLRHPAYRNYPVVGISQKQAMNYSRWRSNRVFEFILIREGAIEYNPNQTKDSYFTIHKYFSGKYQNKSPHANIQYYPQYALPNYMEWQKSLSYFEDKNRELITKHCVDAVTSINSLELNEPDSLGQIIDPLLPVSVSCHKKVFYDMLRGNVAEWSREPNTTLGGGWTDSLSIIMNYDTQHQTLPSVQTGMRCVMRWVKWTDSSQ